MLTKRFLHSASPMDTRGRNVVDLLAVAHTVGQVGNGVSKSAACSHGVDGVDEACELYGKDTVQLVILGMHVDVDSVNFGFDGIESQSVTRYAGAWCSWRWRRCSYSAFWQALQGLHDTDWWRLDDFFGSGDIGEEQE